jgi:hypothetical protein
VATQPENAMPDQHPQQGLGQCHFWLPALTPQAPGSETGDQQHQGTHTHHHAKGIKHWRYGWVCPSNSLIPLTSPSSSWVRIKLATLGIFTA